MSLMLLEILFKLGYSISGVFIANRCIQGICAGRVCFEESYLSFINIFVASNLMLCTTKRIAIIWLRLQCRQMEGVRLFCKLCSEQSPGQVSGGKGNI